MGKFLLFLESKKLMNESLKESGFVIKHQNDRYEVHSKKSVWPLGTFYKAFSSEELAKKYIRKMVDESSKSKNPWKEYKGYKYRKEFDQYEYKDKDGHGGYSGESTEAGIKKYIDDMIKSEEKSKSLAGKKSTPEDIKKLDGFFVVWGHLKESPRVTSSYLVKAKDKAEAKTKYKNEDGGEHAIDQIETLKDYAKMMYSLDDYEELNEVLEMIEELGDDNWYMIEAGT
jgi:hypothetical protein